MATRLIATLLMLAGGPLLAQPLPRAAAERPPAGEPELPASDLLVRYQSPALSFRWSLPAEAALEPALVRLLRSEALATRETEIAEAAEVAKAPRPAGAPPLQILWSEQWRAEAETDGLLAFSAPLSTYTGGAHGNLAFRAALWDRQAGRRIAFAELFADPKGAFALLTPAFCKALDAERATRRQGQKNAAFSDCPDPAAYPIVPMGVGAIHSVRVLVPPYEAGPWSEGAYQIVLPADALRPFVAPRFAASFAAR